MISELALVLRDLHAFAATAGRGLDQNRIADLAGRFLEDRGRLLLTVIARHQRHLGFRHQRLGFALAAHGANRRWRRADKDDLRPGAGFGESCVFGEEAVTWMNSLDTRLFRRFDDGIDLQIAIARQGPANAHGLICFSDMSRPIVDVGKDRHGA